jgi:addiction module HigA family antidote
MGMDNPPHPGEALLEDVLPTLGFSITDAAAQLGATRAALSPALNGKAEISPEKAFRLERWLAVERGSGMPRDAICAGDLLTLKRSGFNELKKSAHWSRAWRPKQHQLPWCIRKPPCYLTG